jgi:hypothetical protein
MPSAALPSHSIVDLTVGTPRTVFKTLAWMISRPGFDRLEAALQARQGWWDRGFCAPPRPPVTIIESLHCRPPCATAALSCQLGLHHSR